MSAEPRTCSLCGAMLPEDAPKGNCPRCLLKLAWAMPAGDESQSFGDYELLGELGRGGMGIVYAAFQKSLNRTVALKMIPAGITASAARRQRFRIEAQVVARLDHPNIVPIYEVGEHAGQPYYTMKLIEGETLEERLAAERKPSGEPGAAAVRPPGREEQRAIGRLVRAVAQAVEHAHQHGVLHRDLKPSNILLDANGEPYLADFGLAKILAQESGLTQSSELVGTPSFMPPELADPESRRVTAAADVYGLGAVLYTLITRHPPFHAETPLQTLEQVRYQEPVSPRELNPALARDLETICLKCLEKEPDRRYGSAGELAEDLGRFMRDEPIVARPVGVVEKAWRWCRRQPKLASLGALLLLVLVAGSIAVLWERRQAEHLKVPPSVYAQPQAQTVLPGSSVTFKVVAGGPGPLSYQWLREGTNVLVGETNAVLTLSGVQGAHAGRYAVVVHNPHGSTVSSNATLEIVPFMGFSVVGEWPGHIRGSAYDVARAGHSAYVALAKGALVILDVRDPARPVRVGGCDTGGPALRLQVVGNHAYVAASSAGLVVIDVSEPTHPKRVGSCRTTGTAFEVQVVGDRAYVADGAGGLQVIDIRDPADPVLIGGCETRGSARGVHVVEPYAYVAGAESGLEVMDVREGAKPMRVGGCDTDGSARGVRVRDHYAYVADYDRGLQVIDVRDPAKPARVGRYDSGGTARSLRLEGRRAYVAAGEAGLQVIDLSDPANPLRAGSHSTGGSAWGVDIEGAYAYVADEAGGLQVIDISDPDRPKLAGHHHMIGRSQTVQVVGKYAFLADGPNGLKVLDVSEPERPVQVGGADTAAHAWDVQVQGGFAYVVAQEAGLQIIDVSDPAQPVRVGSYDTPEMAMGVAVAGSYAYVTDPKNGLLILNVADPSAPAPVGRYDTPGIAWNVEVIGTTAYVADGPSGLAVLDVTDPSRPLWLGELGMAGTAFRVTVVGRYAYVAADYDGFHVIDISDPARPVWVGGFDTRGRATSIQVAGSHLYLTDSSAGLHLFDVRNPAKPIWVGRHGVGGLAWGLDVVGELAYVADANRGLVILKTGQVPLLWSQPVAQTVRAEDDATFRVKVTGPGSMTYQWWYQGTNAVPGATDPALTLTNLQLEQAGAYHVVVSNEFGTVTSAAATLAFEESVR